MDEDVRVVPFPNQTQTPEVQREDAVADALERVGDIPVAKVEAVAALERRPNWPAIITFIAISMLSLSVAVFSTGADDVLRMGAAMALVISILTCGLAVLYRHAPTFWRPGIEHTDRVVDDGVQSPTPQSQRAPWATRIRLPVEVRSRFPRRAVPPTFQPQEGRGARIRTGR